MKINVYIADKVATFFIYCDSYLKKNFDSSFFGSIKFINYKEVFEKYKSILVDNLYFTYLKDLTFGIKTFEVNEDILNLNKNFGNVDLKFWKKEYENFNIDEKFNIHIADQILLQYFGYNIKEDIDVILVPKNSFNELRMHSGVTNSREKSIIFMFVPEYKKDIPYKRVNLEVLIHEIIHLYIYRSDWYKKIYTLSIDKFSTYGDKNKIEGICNELLARVFLTPNTFGLIRGVFNRNDIAIHPLVEPLNITANNILKEILNKKIETINDNFINVFIYNLEKYFISA